MAVTRARPIVSGPPSCGKQCCENAPDSFDGAGSPHRNEAGRVRRAFAGECEVLGPKLREEALPSASLKSVPGSGGEGRTQLRIEGG